MMELWPHQNDDINFASKRPACMLAMPMGTGKTRAAIAVADFYKPRKTLVVAPFSVVGDPDIWPATASKFSSRMHISANVLCGKLTERAAQWKHINRESIALVNYQAVWQDPLASVLLKNPPDMLILDESHHIKSPSGVCSKFLAKLGKRVPLKLELTATPVDHSPLDMWAQERFLGTNLLGTSFFKFKKRHAILGGYLGKEVLSGKNGVPWMELDALLAQISKIAFSCPAPKLPFEEQDIERTFDLEPACRRAYDRLRKDFVTEIEQGTITAPLSITRGMRLHQLATGWGQVDKGPLEPVPSGRDKVLMDILEEIGPDERIVVFARFIPNLDTIGALACSAGRPYYEMSGRSHKWHQWKDTPGAVLGVSISSGPEGLDFSRARYGVFYSLDETPRHWRQSRGRLVRPREDRTSVLPATFITILARNTVDGTILRALRERRSVADAFVASMRGLDN